MVSRMASTCNHYAARCTKIRPEILHPKNSENGKNAPDSARKRRNRVRFGCWRRWERLETGENGWESQVTEPECTPFPYNTCKKKTGENPVFSPAFWQGQKDLNPRHAVLEWMWKRRTGSGGGAVLPNSSSQPEKQRCWFGAFRFSRSKTRIESPLEISLRMSSLKSYICMYTEE